MAKTAKIKLLNGVMVEFENQRVISIIHQLVGFEL